MQTVQAFDRGEMDYRQQPDETDTMGDPRSEGRGLVTGALLAAVFWAGVGGFVWWLLA